MSYYGRNSGTNNHYGSSSKSKKVSLEYDVLKYMRYFSIGSYGNNNRTNNGNNLLDDLDSFDVAPLRPGPPVIKNFYAESPLIVNRPQVRRVDFYC